MIGIVASRLVERHHRPAIVISLDGEGGGRGSGRSIPGFDLLAGLEACAEHLTSFGGHRAAAGLALEAESLDAFREAFAAHAAEVLGPEDLMRTERIDAMVGGADLGLDLAEELGRLAPFGMGNPGVRLLVPAARVRDVRPMGRRASTPASACTAARTGRSASPSAARSSASAPRTPVDAAVRLEVNHWNGAVEPRVVLREIYPHEGRGRRRSADGAEEPGGSASRPSSPPIPAAWPPSRSPMASGRGERTRLPGVGLGGRRARRARLERRRGARPGRRPAARARRWRATGRQARRVRRAGARPGPGGAASSTSSSSTRRPSSISTGSPRCRCAEGGGYLHPAWGEPELRFALAALGDQLAQRGVLAGVFRDLRDAGEGEGPGLLRGPARRRRPPARAGGGGPLLRASSPSSAWCRERRTVAAAGVGVVSSEGTDLERSTAYRAYSARYQEGRRYLEGRKQT